MAASKFFLVAVVAFAFAGMASAEFMKGRSLKPYKQGAKETGPNVDDYSLVKIQGLIYGNKGGKLFGLEGALARVTCLAMSERGYESAPFSVVTPRTDAKGYFRINMGKYQLKNFRLESCRVFLEAPAPGIYDVPTDINHGLTGAPLVNPRPVGANSLLYSVGPFVYNPSPY